MSIEPFIKCSDIQESLKFYCETLDFAVIVAPDPDPRAFMSRYAYLERNGDGVHLSSHPGDREFGNEVYVRVDDVEALYQSFLARNINIDDPDQWPAVTIQLVEQSWGMKEFSVRDPDGNMVELVGPMSAK